MEKEQSRFFSPLVILGITLGLSIILSTYLGMNTFYKIKTSDDVIAVTGSASVNVASDQVKWLASISRQVTASNLKSGYGLMATDWKTVSEFYKSHGIDLTTLNVSPVYMDEVYEYKANGETGEKKYNLRQTIELSSSDVNGITALAKDASQLGSQGVIFQTQGLEYYYSKLPDLRVSLLSDAVKDAKVRAQRIVEPSGQKVGALKSASSGVVQVLSENSVDISDYGTYDTSRINKKVMITVRASFSIK